MKKLMIILLTSAAIICNSAVGQYDHERKFNLDQIFFHSEFEKSAVINYLNGSNRDKLGILLASSPQIDKTTANEYKAIFEEFINDLKRKKEKYKKSHNFLEYVFFKVHRKFLKHYQNYVTVEKLFDKQYYDCVVGSAFYALVLSELGYDYHIIETNYHMFVMLELDKSTYLLESTDPLNGFVHGIDDVIKRIENIKQLEKDIEADNQNSETFTYKYVIHRDIDLIQLAGLQYFNLATIAYNNSDFEEAINCVQKGRLFYDSKRMQEMMKLIVNNYQGVAAKNTEQ